MKRCDRCGNPGGCPITEYNKCRWDLAVCRCGHMYIEHASETRAICFRMDKGFRCLCLDYLFEYRVAS